MVDEVFKPLMTAHGIPGLAVGISHAGVRHLFHYGVASRETGQPVDANTLFEIGSLSKTLTATFAGYAHEARRISLDAAAAEYVPELRGSPIGRATLLQLGTYTAGGLPLQFPEAVADTAAALRFLREFQPTAQPGTRRRYSNPSIGLLGHAAARAIGREFAEASEAELFPRLRLAQTFIRVPPLAGASYAWGYDKAMRPIRVNPGAFDAEAYGVKSTAADMLRFVEANLRPASLEPVMRRAVERTHEGRFRVGPMVQGLGWEQYPWPVGVDMLLDGNSSAMALEAHAAEALRPAAGLHGNRLFNKTGSTNGFGCYAAFVPGLDIGIVMLANKNFPNAARVGAAHVVLTTLLSARSGRGSARS
ncbi:Beta-lactamase [Burkholderiales bacterium 8X]|nr:Beta-lactamase [Burkholderiales bacterium 8X]